MTLILPVYRGSATPREWKVMVDGVDAGRFNLKREAVAHAANLAKAAKDGDKS